VTAKKIGRNEPCPCKSGKKYKVCCGGNGARSTESKLDRDTANPKLGSRVLIVPASDEMLMNRVQREAVKVAEGFDNLTGSHVQLIDRLYSNAAGIVMMGKQHAEFEHDDVRMTFAILLSNVLKSFTAAFSLLRSGWRLQPFMCLRNAYEGLGVAIHLAQRPETLCGSRTAIWTQQRRSRQLRTSYLFSEGYGETLANSSLISVNHFATFSLATSIPKRRETCGTHFSILRFSFGSPARSSS
jgi:hypothetical protein